MASHPPKLGNLIVEIADQIGDFHSFEVRHVGRVFDSDRLQIILIDRQEIQQFCKFYFEKIKIAGTLMVYTHWVMRSDENLGSTNQ